MLNLLKRSWYRGYDILLRPIHSLDGEIIGYESYYRKEGSDVVYLAIAKTVELEHADRLAQRAIDIMLLREALDKNEKTLDADLKQLGYT